MHPLVKLAKNTVETYIKEGKLISPPGDLTPEMTEKAGTFVSIKKRGELRGCIGTFLPTTQNVAHEIIQNAISAATQDPRFSPIHASELSELEYSVDVLSQPEKVEGYEELNPKKYGVIVESENRRGLLLPDLEGVNTVEEQIRIAMLKTGISSAENIELYRFEVKRYK
ncbi:MAG: AmmeMemoRadiSam system protein A [Nitrospirae bacterium]|nr:AmmeMemoRadiSam system protein A [Nitrospirota bacterium]